MDRTVRRLLIGALLCAAGVALLALLFYGSDRFNDLDHRLTARLLAPEGSLRESAFHAAAELAEPVPLAVALAAVTVLGLIWRRPWHLLAAGGVVLAANVTTQVMKAVLAHPRLQGAFGATHHIDVGYPSGHTTAAFSAGFALWLVAPVRYRRRAGLIGVAYGCLVAAGVVVAGWHYVSDVLGAILVVGFWGMLALAALQPVSDPGGFRVRDRGRERSGRTRTFRSP